MCLSMGITWLKVKIRKINLSAKYSLDYWSQERKGKEISLSLGVWESDNKKKGLVRGLRKQKMCDLLFIMPMREKSETWDYFNIRNRQMALEQRMGKKGDGLVEEWFDFGHGDFEILRYSSCAFW